MSVSLKEFINLVGDSGVISAAEIGSVLDGISESDRLQNGDQLVSQGWLSTFQVDLICRGEGKRLVLGNYVIVDRLGQGGMGGSLQGAASSDGSNGGPEVAPMTAK